MNKNLPPSPSNKGPQMLTDRIRATEVRLLDGESSEIVPRAQAEAMADERGLDLVIVSLDSSPPVVRLVDYGKFKFEAEKKAREARKKQHVIEIKEVKMSIRIDKHDYGVKLDHARKFLQDGNKVKVTIRLKGRETQHSELAFELGKRFIVDLEDLGANEYPLRLEGRTLNIIVAPHKAGTKAAAAAPKAGDKPASPEKPSPGETPPNA